MCLPTSAHEPNETPDTQASGSTNSSGIGTKLESIKGAVDALAAAVAAAAAAVRSTNNPPGKCLKDVLSNAIGMWMIPVLLGLLVPSGYSAALGHANIKTRSARIRKLASFRSQNRK